MNDLNRKLRVALAAAFVAATALAGTAPAAMAADLQFGAPSARSSFGKGIDFVQPFTGSVSVEEVDIVVQYQGSFGVSVAEAETSGSNYRYTIDTSKGQLQPNTKVTAHFEVQTKDGRTLTGPSLTTTYVDDRYKWHTKAGKLVTLHWYEGSDSFASQALKIGEDGIEHAAAFLGIDEKEPIDFFVYADQNPFYDALGPSTRDNVGGEANTQTRTLFALISPNELGYAASVVPHELTHVVFDDMTLNPYHMPPHWLNEGVAVYVSQGYDSSDKSLVNAAVRSESVMPLSAIRGQFPTTQDQFYLAYAESVSAVDFFVRKYGHDAMVKLLKTFRTGASDDEAFKAAISLSVDDFDRAWQADLGVTAVAAYGPKAAPTGPVPPGWTAGGLGGDGQPAPAETPGGQPQAPSAVPSTSPAQRPDGGTPFWPIAIAALAFLAAAVLFMAGRSRSTLRRPPPTGPR